MRKSIRCWLFFSLKSTTFARSEQIIPILQKLHKFRLFSKKEIGSPKTLTVRFERFEFHPKASILIAPKVSPKKVGDLYRQLLVFELPVV